MSGHRALRMVLIGFAAVLVLLGIAAAVLVWRFDPNAYKPRIEAAVRNATGRDLALGGPIRLSLFPLGITLHDLALSNPPGFASQQMARVRQITLRLDLAPLLHRRLVVRELDIDRPEVALERNAAGVPNWSFAPPGPPGPQPGTPSGAEAVGPRTVPSRGASAAVLDARITDGVLSYRDARSGQAYTLALPHLAVSAATPDAPMHLAGQAVLADTTLTLDADAGPLAGFARSEFWPLRLKAEAEGHGLRVALDLTAPAADQPMRAAAQGSLRDTPFAAAASLGTPSQLAGAGPAFPVSLEAQAASAKLALSGAVARPAQMAGVDLALTAQVPDLAALSPLAGRPLPTLRGIAVSTRLADLGGLRTGVALRELRLTAAPGDLAGSAEVVFAPRPTLRADLTGTRLDLAALRATMPRPSQAPAPPPPASTAVPGVPTRAPASPGPVIPDTPIPFAALHAADADLRLRLGTLGFGAATLRNVDAHLGMAGGATSLSAQGAFGTGPVALTATADARIPPNLALALNAPALPLATLLAATGQPEFAAGTISVTAALRGSGASPHAIAAGLDGSAAATMSGGTIETQVLERALGPIIARANPLGALGGGRSDIRCLAVRLRATRGIAELAPLLLASSLVTLDGTGRIDLATETLDLHLHPQGRAGGISFSVPVTVQGGFRAPRIGTSQPAAAAAGVQAALGLLAGRAGLGAEPAGPSCAAALQAARG